MRRVCISLLSLFVLLLVSTHSALAQERDFKTYVTARYSVNDQGVTTVTQSFIIENNKPDIFLKQYTVSFTDPKFDNLSVIYNGTTIEPNVEQDGSSTKITLTFPQQLVGQGKKHEFNITYKTTSIATVTGKVLEVHVPQLKDTSTIDSFVTELVTPSEFGQPSRISPVPQATRAEDQHIINTFANQSSETITAFFGSTQYFKLGIRYNLQNAGTAPAFAQVALPPDTSYQRVFYEQLEPRPESIEKDEDGNWIATYLLPANTTVTPQLSGIVQLQLSPFPEVPVTLPQTFHTATQEYWQVDDPQIQTIATEYADIYSQYSYVIDTLEYSTAENIQDSKRMGAVGALQQPTNAVCQEYADTFVTLARSSKIPARVLTGYGYTNDPTLRPQNLEGDVLHAWAEYYDSANKLWKQVDPTWEDTTGGLDYFNQFDLNHIVFAINGKSSTIPYPGGSYKSDNQKSKDVEINISDSIPTPTPQLTTAVTPKKLLHFPIPGMYTLSILNETGVAWYNIGIQTTAQKQKIHVEERNSGSLLPFQTLDLPLYVSNNDWQLRKEIITVTISVPYNETHVTTNIEVTSIPTEIYWFIQNRRIIGMAVGGCIITVIAGSILVLRRKRKRSVRRKS